MDRSTLAAALFVVLTSSALAQTPANAPAAPVATQPSFSVSLTSQDAGNVNQICLMASDAAKDLNTKGQIAQWCLAFLNRLAQAEREAKSTAQGGGAKTPEAVGKTNETNTTTNTEEKK